MGKDYRSLLPDVENRYMLECRYKKLGKDFATLGDSNGTINPICGFIYAENEMAAVGYAKDFILRYSGDNLLLDDGSILVFENGEPADLYYDFFCNRGRMIQYMHFP